MAPCTAEVTGEAPWATQGQRGTRALSAPERGGSSDKIRVFSQTVVPAVSRVGVSEFSGGSETNTTACTPEGGPLCHHGHAVLSSAWHSVSPLPVVTRGLGGTPLEHAGRKSENFLTTRRAEGTSPAVARVCSVCGPGKPHAVRQQDTSEVWGRRSRTCWPDGVALRLRSLSSGAGAGVRAAIVVLGAGWGAREGAPGRGRRPARGR